MAAGYVVYGTRELVEVLSESLPSLAQLVPTFDVASFDAGLAELRAYEGEPVTAVIAHELGATTFVWNRQQWVEVV